MEKGRDCPPSSVTVGSVELCHSLSLSWGSRMVTALFLFRVQAALNGKALANTSEVLIRAWAASFMYVALLIIISIVSTL